MTAGQPAPNTLAGFRLLRVIGEGATGTVHLAEDLATGALVALKVVALPHGAPAGAAGRHFLDAARAAMSLRHPDIVAVLDAGVEHDHAWLSMEPVPGTDLARYTRRPRLLPEALVLRIGARLAMALGHAHAQGVIHRDLKPANVLVNWADDSVKLADFGIARSGGTVDTNTGIVPGTPSYMAPEQLAGAPAEAAADFYALGALLFELLTGRLPHEAASLGELLRRVAQEMPPDLRSLRPDLPEELASVLARLLAKQPTARLTDGRALADTLRTLAAGLPHGGAKSRRPPA